MSHSPPPLSDASDASDSHASDGEGEDDDYADVEEEPLLKYRRVKAGVIHILTGGSFIQDDSGRSINAPKQELRPPDAATCIVLHKTCMVLGTQSGAVYVLDHVGNEISRHSVHTARVNDVGIDSTGQRIVSCGDDGKVVVYSSPSRGGPIDSNSVGSGGSWSSGGEVSSQVTNYGRPMLSAAIDPAIVGKRERVFISGCADGRLRVNNKGWFRSSDTVLHEGEGPVHLVRWEGSLVAWANDYGIKLYDNVNHQRISYIERPRPRMGSTRAFDVRACRCHLFWEVPEKTLLVGWGDCWMVVQITTRVVMPAGAGSSASSANGGIASKAPQTKVRCAEIIALHYTQDHVISGICAFGEDIALLAYVPPEELHEDESSDDEDYIIAISDAASIRRASLVGGTGNGTSSALNGSSSMRMRPSRPELRIVDRQTGDQLSCDMLPVYGFARCGPNDYYLESDRAHSAVSRQRQLQQDRRNGVEADPLPSMYIVSPKDVVVASPRTVDDHIKWALEHDQYDQALIIAEHAEPPLSRDRMQNLAERYLAHLVQDGEFEQAAALCPRLLQLDKDMWSRWVLVFAEHSELLLIGPHVPTAKGCRLPPSTYEMILAAFLDETMVDGATMGGDEQVATSFLNLIVKWLPDDPPANSSGASTSLSLGSSVLDPTSTSGGAPEGSERETLLFDVKTIIRKLEQILQDLAAAVSHMSSKVTRNESGRSLSESKLAKNVTKPLLHLALAQMYTTLGQYGKAIEEYLDSSLLQLNVQTETQNEELGRKPGFSFAVKADSPGMNSFGLETGISLDGQAKLSSDVEMKQKQDRLLSRRLRVFSLIRNHSLYNVILAGEGERIAGLLRLDAKRALELFIDAPQHIKSRSTGGTNAGGIGSGGGGSNPVETMKNVADGNGKLKGKKSGAILSVQSIANKLQMHPTLQLVYLDGIWQHPKARSEYNSSAYSELHKLQVELYARLQPKDLLEFLKSSEHYDLRRAYEVCQNCEPPMYQEMVYILSRLGNTKEALALIIEELEDVKQAIDFIKDSHDASLWADLVERSLKSPRFIAGLLGNIGASIMMEKEQGVDPAQLISKIPLGMRVPGLRDKLVKIISDYTMQLQLRESCNLVLKADCFELLKKLCYQQRRAMRVVADPSELQTLHSLPSQSKRTHRTLDGRAGRNVIRNKSSRDISSGFPLSGRRSRPSSIGNEAERYSSSGEHNNIVVPFSDRIHYLGANWTDHMHSTRNSRTMSTDIANLAGQSGGAEAPRLPASFSGGGTPSVYAP